MAGKKKTAKSGTKSKRPLGAYMLFAIKERAAVVAAHPNYKVPEIGRELGKRWRELSEDQKKHYETLAKKQ
jgi:structure-specific recognition protein 1